MSLNPKFLVMKMLINKFNQNIRIHQISIIVICCLLFFDFYLNDGSISESSVVVRIKNPKFTVLTPNNTENGYSVDDEYNTLLGIKDFSFLINPQSCQNSSLLLVILVSSKPTHYDNRKVIRQTWGKVTEATKIFFLIGKSKKRGVNKKIANESSIYGDIIKGSFIDDYRNMTYKHLMGLKWIAHHCPTAKYVLKSDDDVVVNIFKLRRFLVRDLSPWGAKGLITCQVLANEHPHRRNSKWTVSVEEYSEDYYPPYCSGWAILYSQDVVPRLLQATQTLDFFWIDDVLITGIAAEKIAVARTPLSPIIVYYGAIKNEYLDVRDFLLGPPNCNTSLMAEIWKKYLLAHA